MAFSMDYFSSEALATLKNPVFKILQDLERAASTACKAYELNHG